MEYNSLHGKVSMFVTIVVFRVWQIKTMYGLMLTFQTRYGEPSSGLSNLLAGILTQGLRAGCMDRWYGGSCPFYNTWRMWNELEASWLLLLFSSLFLEFSKLSQEMSKTARKRVGRFTKLLAHSTTPAKFQNTTWGFAPCPPAV